MNIIVLGTNHYNTLGLIWSLGIARHKVTLLLYDSQNSYVSKSKFVDKTIILHEGDDIVSIIKHVASEMQCKPVILVTNDKDATLLNEKYSELTDCCYFEGGSPEGNINLYRNKDYGEQLAVECGLSVPRTLTINDPQELKDINIAYPLLIKANNSVYGGKDAMRKCDSYFDAEQFVNNIPIDYFPIQIQEFIDKEYEVMLLGCSLYAGKKVICPVANKKLRHYPDPIGLGSYSESLEVCQHEALQKLSTGVAQYLQKIKYTGLFSAEFLYREGQYYFLEVNLRNDGTSWISTCSGFNLPDMVCKAFVDDSVSSTNGIFKSVTFMNILADVNHVRNKQIKLRTWLRQLIRCGSYSHYNKRDLYPFMTYIWPILKRAILKGNR